MQPCLVGCLVRLGNAQLWMRSSQGVFAVREQFLVELLARAQAGNLDSDVFLAESRQPDHVARKVDNPDWFAHFQNEDLASISHETCLQHQLCGLGNRHEVARDLRVGHRQRSAASDLLAELGNDAACAAEYVSEADHDKTRAARTL